VDSIRVIVTKYDNKHAAGWF